MARMRVVIIGAGEVGTTLAENLAHDHEVVVIERDPTVSDAVRYKHDVLTVTGDGTSRAVLQTAEVEKADMLIACTDDDLANLVACGTAKTLNGVFTIARVKSSEYLRTWEASDGAFGVDFLVCTNLLAAESIVRVIGLPAAVDVDPFAGGLVQMAEFEIAPESPIGGMTVQEADRFDSLTFVGLFRNGDLTLPRGDTVIQAGDRAVVIGSPGSVQSFATDVAPEETPTEADEIVIVGGSEIGFHTARLLAKRGLRPRLIEEDYERARWLAEELPDVTVLEHTVTDRDFLSRQHVDEADIVVAALEKDEANLFVGVIAKRMGARRVIAVVNSGDFVLLFKETGIDVVVNPREVIAEELTRFTYDDVAMNVSMVENDQAEVLEIVLTEDSKLVGPPIQELDDLLEAEFVIGAITRRGSLITPRGDTRLEPEDHLVVFVETEHVSEVTALA